MGADPVLARFCGREAGPLPATLIVAAHPDDETIGAGARLAHLAASCWIVHVTDGAPADRRFFPASMANATRAAYARARRDELARALSVVGLDPSRAHCLGVRDQEAVFDLVRIAERLAQAIEERGPDAVVTHPYEGGHPDHDATAFGVHAAAELLERKGKPAPRILEMASYHDVGGQTVRGEFLPWRGAVEIEIPLADDERRRKRSMFSAFATQREVLSAFKHECERFRVAPRYDFTRPPHEGRLHYERFGAGVAGSTWRAFARAAIKKLALRGGGP